MGLPPVQEVQSEDKYLYHTTSKSNKRSINRNGLDPSYEKQDGLFDNEYAPKAEKFVERIAEKTGHDVPFSRSECVFFFILWDHIEGMYQDGRKESSVVFVVDASKIDAPIYVADSMAFTEVMDGFALRDDVHHTGMERLTPPSPDELANHAYHYLESIDKVDDLDGLKQRAWEAAQEEKVMEAVVPGVVDSNAIIGDLQKD